MSTLRDKVRELPLLPGCYIFKNVSGEIIYIGKSKCLKKRVSQYFQRLDKLEKEMNRPSQDKIENLVKEIYDFDYMITNTETDALLLECKLIKEHRPRYNSQLKRNRSYPFLFITKEREYPGIYISVKEDTQDVYRFGCFRNVEDAENTLLLINSIWKTPICGQQSFDKNQKRSCLNKQIGKCSAPCTRAMKAEEYQCVIKEVKEFLQNKNKKILQTLRKEMQQYAEALEFERALEARDKIFKLEQLQKRTRKFNTDLKNKDYCVFLRAYHEKGLSVFYIRDGIVCARMRMKVEEKPNEGAIQEFVTMVSKGMFETSEDNGLAACITAVYADKLYEDVTDVMKRKRGKEALLLQRIRKGYLEFVGDDMKTNISDAKS